MSMTNNDDIPLINKDDFQVACGICGKGIPKKKERVEVHIYLQDGGEQILFVHKKCLKRVLDPSVPVGF